jgi:signal transduction histidine kinase/ActR/RegA family two-component response regulator
VGRAITHATAGDVARRVSPLAFDAPSESARQAFAADRSLYAIPIVGTDGRPVGLINRFTFLELLATRYGHALSMNRTVTQYMDAGAMLVEAATPVDALAARFDGSDERLFDGFIVTRDGEYFGVSTRAVLVRALDARLLERTRTLELEIIERRRTENELIVAKAAAEDASVAKSTFLANMSHELRTPLNAIIGYSEMLLEDALADEQTSHAADLTTIVGAGRHLLTLITGILDLSKVEAGRMELDLDTFDLADLIRDIAETSQLHARTGGNRLETQGLDGIGFIRGDRTKVKQILLNLIGNACKFTDRGLVTVRATRHAHDGGESAVIDVVDTGVGMSADQCGRVFQDFTQADATTTRKFGGTGLGLAISRRLCHLMHGSLTVESELGRGSTFTVRLPTHLEGVVEPQAPARRPLRLSASADTTPGTALATERRPTVLIVDDDPAALDLMSRTLDRAGFTAVTASSAEEGLDIARAVPPAAIVSDVMLPGMTGWNLLEAMKAEKALQHIPVVVLSVNEDRRHSLALGAVEHLTKPVVADLLVTLLRSATTAAADDLRAGLPDPMQRVAS